MACNRPLPARGFGGNEGRVIDHQTGLALADVQRADPLHCSQIGTAPVALHHMQQQQFGQHRGTVLQPCQHKARQFGEGLVNRCEQRQGALTGEHVP